MLLNAKRSVVFLSPSGLALSSMSRCHIRTKKNPHDVTWKRNDYIWESAFIRTIWPDIIYGDFKIKSNFKLMTSVLIALSATSQNNINTWRTQVYSVFLILYFYTFIVKLFYTIILVLLQYMLRFASQLTMTRIITIIFVLCSVLDRLLFTDWISNNCKLCNSSLFFCSSLSPSLFLSLYIINWLIFYTYKRCDVWL